MTEAHKEFFEMRKGLKNSDCTHPGKPCGLMDINIIIQAVIRGKRIFNYIARYENSH